MTRNKAPQHTGLTAGAQIDSALTLCFSDLLGNFRAADQQIMKFRIDFIDLSAKFAQSIICI